MEKYYITTPIYYPSDKLHIGHSYTTVAADAMARYKRLKGYDVMFLTGTDEHGQKIQRKAEEMGITPKQYVDNIVSGIIDLWKLMKISNDDFIRTTDKRHEDQLKVIFKKLYDKGDIYKGNYEGLYCTPCEAFWTATQAKDGKCPDCGRPVEPAKEEAYFFKLSSYTQKLIDYIESHPDFIQPPSRKNEMINNFLKPGLEDLCVSRTTFNWGVPVEFDPGHVVYVWMDALSNYITALGAFSEDRSKYEKYWPADVHLVGKEIVRFHTIIWPAILMALGEPLPKQVFGHGWLLLEGGKMSKSIGNVVDPVVLIDKYGLDAIRYFLLREVPFGADGLFSNEALITRINADLANDLGNLVSRTVAMAEKYFDGALPAERESDSFDDNYKEAVYGLTAKVDELMDKFQFSLALTEIWKVIGASNKYIDGTMPWLLAKDPAKKPRLAQVLYNLTETIRRVAILIQPFMVETPQKIFEQIGLAVNTEATAWDSLYGGDAYPDGARVSKGNALFPRIDIESELKNMADHAAQADANAAAQAAAAQEVKSDKAAANTTQDEEQGKAELISIDDFAKVELRVGKVVTCEKIEKSDKLLKLMIDIGTEVRQVVSGIAKYYAPEDVVGKQVVVVTNLKPVKLRGVESYGMILCASTEDKLMFVSPEDDISAGAEVR